MQAYPVLEINRELAYRNAVTLRQRCLAAGVEPTAVIKGFNAEESIVDAIVAAGYCRLASSRLVHLRQVKQRGYAAETMALRIPMLSELEDLVRYADISLNSEPETLCAINAEAGRQGRRHKAILMRDLGDLREGIFDRDRFYQVAEMVERELPQVELYGIGVNLTCYGSVIPTTDNLSLLTADAREIERRIGRRLAIVSGGATSSLPLVIKGGLPAGINDLRIGEALVVPCDLLGYWGCAVPELSNRVLLLKAEIIEIGAKPTMPLGAQGPNGFGSYRRYEDRGVRRRALLALGVFDIGDYDKLLPVDPDLSVLGGSSDHLIVDIHDSKRQYRLGDTVEFELCYKSMLFATGNPLVRKVRVK